MRCFCLFISCYFLCAAPRSGSFRVICARAASESSPFHRCVSRHGGQLKRRRAPTLQPQHTGTAKMEQLVQERTSILEILTCTRKGRNLTLQLAVTMSSIRLSIREPKFKKFLRYWSFLIKPSALYSENEMWIFSWMMNREGLGSRSWRNSWWY
jgi:hypothetical protein